MKFFFLELTIYGFLYDYQLALYEINIYDIWHAIIVHQVLIRL